MSLDERRDWLRHGIHRLAQDIRALDELLQILVAVVLEESEVDVRDILRVGRSQRDGASLGLGLHVYQRAGVLLCSVPGGEARPEALEGEGAAPGEDIPSLVGCVGGAEDGGDQA